ncbi:DUF2306 domain-containing protein [Dinoroseobacter sp. PD6]|uniref:DUF2306 domain-containing protein n=1 Tax=Dinoroseobacter sp. PD6 TaxID=3028384 RepID=UPI00237B831C|nr:DUF2306 domain-containing protein [Dinoroseobacter sp. PD6]MDD9718637.1 DUF2306 domain-containing protein [Dinoroseobacter sp. PD6]
MHHIRRREWAFLALIVLYSFIPSVFGLLRIPELLGGPMIIPPNPRAVIDPLPIALHILGSSIFCLVGALQFLPSLRRHRPALHRTLGRIVAAAGCVSALTGLWMTVSYAFPDALQGPLLYWARVTLSLAMVAFIVWAVVAIRARETAAHRAAMLRAYAIGQGASTQTALLLIGMIFMKTEPLGLNRDLLMVGAWAINLAVAELFIRRVFATRRQPAAISSGP